MGGYPIYASRSIIGTVLTWQLFKSYCKRSSPSLMNHMCLPPEGTCGAELVTAADTGVLGACQNSDVSFRKIF
jgi:hypothetical protein